MMASNLPQKVSHGVDELRDRAAEAISADGESIFRALRRLSERIDEAESTLQDRILDAEVNLEAAMKNVAKKKRRASWPRRLFWLMLGAGTVAAILVSVPERAKELRDKLQA
jgi:phage terminase Nu1 subunit (DNA packaging protein)